MVCQWLARDGGAQENCLYCWYSAGWKGAHIARKPFPLLCQASFHGVPLPAFQLLEVIHPSSAKTLSVRVVVPLPSHRNHHIRKPSTDTPSQTPPVPASSSTFLQSTWKPSFLHMHPFTVLLTSFEGKLEVELQTWPLGAPRQQDEGAKSTAWLSRHRCRYQK